MTLYRPCVGCVRQGQPCEHREHIRETIKGLSVTLINFRCPVRELRFSPGDPVFAEVQSGPGSMEDGYYGVGGPTRETFPGVVTSVKPPNVVVYIAPGAASEGQADILFEPVNGSGFCKVPMSRVKQRDGEREAICSDCGNPASIGHADGYICAYKAARGDGA